LLNIYHYIEEAKQGNSKTKGDQGTWKSSGIH